MLRHVLLLSAASLLMFSCEGSVLGGPRDAGGSTPWAAEDGGALDVDAGVDSLEPGEPDAGEAPDAGDEIDGGILEPDAGVTDAGTSTDAGIDGPQVDRSSPKLYTFDFTAAKADAAATQALGTQTSYLDTRVAPKGLLVVYLHGAGAPSTCGSREHEKLVASWGFHVLGPCYLSDYGVSNCGNDIGGCRMEAFEGVDHSSVIDVKPPNSIERRIVMGLKYLQTQHAGGDWQYFIDGDKPRWSKIIISGHSHGASSAGVIAKKREVAASVMLAGPYDTNQAWLAWPSLTPASRMFGFSHTDDAQHPGHLQAWATMMLPGSATSIDGKTPPYGGSHRLYSESTVSDGHLATQAGGSSPKNSDGTYRFEPAWQLLYAP